MFSMARMRWLAPAARSFSTAPRWLFAAALNSGVSPKRSTTFLSAPPSRSSEMHSAWPLDADRWRGVSWNAVSASTSDPFRRRLPITR
ncbi:unnamed protein product [Ectocarpus fasciculatus]